MGFILVEQTQTSVQHTKFSLLYFVEYNQTMPEWKYSKCSRLIINTRWRWRYCCTKRNIVHIFAISGGWGIFLPFFFLCSKRTAYWLNQSTFCTLLGELNFDLCESGLQRLTKVDLSNRASSIINLQIWNSFLRYMHFFLMPTIKLIENYIAAATTLIKCEEKEPVYYSK